MGEMSPNTAEKLKGLFGVTLKRKVDAAEAAGASANMMSRYLSGTKPSAEVLVRLARFFEVDLAWLADDSQPWTNPPPKPGTSLTDAELMDEVRLRYMLRASEALELIGQAEAIDWDEIAEALAAGKVGSGNHPDVDAAAEAARMLWRFPDTLAQFDTGMILPWNESWLRTRPIDRESFKFYDLSNRVHAILNRLTATEEARAVFHGFLARIDKPWRSICIPARLRDALQRYRKERGLPEPAEPVKDTTRYLIDLGEDDDPLSVGGL